MPRSARVTVPGQLHHVLLRAATDTFRTEADCIDFLACMRGAAQRTRTSVCAYVLLPRTVHVLAYPAQAASLAAFVQDICRIWVRGFNARYGLHGSPWRGRFCSAAFEEPAWLLALMRYVETQPVLCALADQAQSYRWSSCPSRLCCAPSIVPLCDPPAWWGLGNTPFERQARYQAFLAEPESRETVRQIESATLRGRPQGSDAWWAACGLPPALRPSGRRPGRPRKSGFPSQGY